MTSFMGTILNRKHALTNLTDADFEALLPQLAAELAANGVLRETYADADIQKDWILLLKKNATVYPYGGAGGEAPKKNIFSRRSREKKRISKGSALCIP